jgi:hypothetical protein
MNVGVDNLAVCQKIGFAADSLETQTANDAWRKTQLSGETGVDDDSNFALRRDGLQNNNCSRAAVTFPWMAMNYVAGERPDSRSERRRRFFQGASCGPSLLH